MKKKAILLNWLVFISLIYLQSHFAYADSLAERIANKHTIMIIINDVGNAADFTGYAENLLKKSLKERGAAIINPEIMEKVKENKLLMKAIENANASAMVKIATDYGANILIRGTLSVDALKKFSASWEGAANMSLTAIDISTAEEISNVFSDPLGSTLNPAPIEDSPLIAKQIAVQKICHNVLLKIGVIADSAALKGVTTIGFDFHDIFTLSPGRATAIEFSADGRFLLAGGGKTIRSWDLINRQINQEYRIKNGHVSAVAISPDNQKLAVGNNRGIVEIFSLDSPRAYQRITGHRRAITALAFSPDSRLIASGVDKICQIHSIQSGAKLITLKGHRKTVNSIAFTPNGRHLISAGSDRMIKWWDINVSKEKKSIQESADKLLNMKLSHDGSMIALSTVDIHIDLVRNSRKDIRHVRIRNTITGEEIRTLEGHKKDITTLAFHPNKRFLASGSIDNTIRVWDLQKGDIVTFFEKEDDIISVKFSLDGQWFAALTKNQRLSVWKLR